MSPSSALVKNQAFYTPSARRITVGKTSIEVTLDQIVDILATRIDRFSPDDQYLHLTEDPLPRKWYRYGLDEKEGDHNRDIASRLFLKHGPVVFSKRIASQGEIQTLRNQHVVPLDLRRERYDHHQGIAAGYSVAPVQTRSNTNPFAFSLVDAVRAAHSATYSMIHDPATVQVYDHGDKETQGAKVTVTFPRPVQRRGSTSVTFQAVPVEDNLQAWVLAHDFKRTHGCRYHGFRNIRYQPPNSLRSVNEQLICPHEIQAYLHVIDHYAQEGNLVPIALSVVPIISQRMAEIYDIIDKHVVIGSPEKPQRLLEAQKEVILKKVVDRLGHYELLESHTFVGEGKGRVPRDPKLREYHWEGMPRAA